MRFLVAALLVAVLAAPAEAQGPRPPAEDAATAQARVHFRRGTELYKEARYREAIAEFQEAYRLRPHGVIRFNLAQCQERVGDIPAALDEYRKYLREVPDAQDRRTVLAAIANLEKRLGSSGVLLVYSDPPEAEVLVDGQAKGPTPLALLLAEGSHSVSVVKPGYRSVTRQAVLSSRVSLQMDVSLQKLASVPLPPPPVVAAPAPVAPSAASPEGERSRGAGTATPSGKAPGAAAAPHSATAPAPRPAPPGPKPRIWTWVAAGAAAAALGTGVYYGVQAKSAQDDLRGTVHDAATATKLSNDARSRARTANILYGVGGVAAGGACALFFYEGKF